MNDSETGFDPKDLGLPETTTEQEAAYQDETPDAPVAEAPAPAEPQPEPAKVEPEPVEPPKGYVPHAALHEEREERKRLAKELAEIKAALDALKPKQPEPQPEPDWPDPILDPAGFKARQIAELQKRDERINAFEAQQRAQAEDRFIAQAVQAAEAEFVAATPDYQQALDHLASVRMRELALFGLDEASARKQLGVEAREIAQAAFRSGKNPARMAYEIAQARGYAAKKPEPAPAAEAEKIVAQATAAAQTARLPSGGGAELAPITVATAAQMSEAEWAKLSKSDRERILRGG